uniref:Tudor domain-containing protein n=1 Tax=Glossina brevipalpis TaxID=37001 RepID=A0A1A9W2S8_9MUSC
MQVYGLVSSPYSLKDEKVEIKSMEIQLEEYATETTEAISNYFLFLHGILQNEEKRIMDTFKRSCEEPQLKLKKTFQILTESQEDLNVMRGNLEEYLEKPPYDINLNAVIKICNKQLEKIPCRLQVTKIQDNPFRFEIKKDIFENLKEYYNYYYADPGISIKLGKFHEDINSILKSSMLFDNTVIAQFCQKDSTSNKKEKNFQQNKMTKSSKSSSNSNSSDSLRDNSPPVTSLMNNMRNSLCLPDNNDTMAEQHHIYVRVTNVWTPDRFYVQIINETQKISEFSNIYSNCVSAERVPITIEENRFYMVYHRNDKQWYRAILNKILARNLCRMFLMDFGMMYTVNKDRLREMDADHEKVPFAAKRCAIHNIIPANIKWTKEARHFLIEITQNSPARLSIIENFNDRRYEVDLHNNQTKSIRESFLYTGLARDKPGFSSFKAQIKTIIPNFKVENGLIKHYFQAGEIFNVTITHLVNPQEFYVIKNDLIHEQQQFQNDLNECYGSTTIKHKQLYLGTIQMYCVVCLDESWHRAVIEEIKKDGYITVRLVDKGTRELINWRQAYIVEERFRKVQEYALRCGLADIEPLQENDYTYTSTAIKDFKQMATNPNLRIEICSVRENGYKVALFVIKKKMDINVGASLVKSKYGISTGEATQEPEISGATKNQFQLTELFNHERSIGGMNLFNTSKKGNTNNASSEKMANKILKRTPVIITHIVNPGEFYIKLSSLSEGTNVFHKQIQDTQNQKYQMMSKSEISMNWNIGDVCMVYAKCQYTSNTSSLHEKFNLSLTLLENKEWYRGVIIDIITDSISKLNYSIFLRDVGTTLQSISVDQLFPIDPLLNRVSNSVYRCKLACVEPAGGQNWSLTSIDCFKHCIKKFESLGSTLQSKCLTDKKSIPIVLWGLITETSDPLAPCITKYSNINYILVKKGLAHLTEPLDTSKQFDQIEQIELAEDEIKLEEWVKSFANNAMLTAIERIADNPLRNSRDGICGDSLSEKYASCIEFSFEYDELSDIPTTGQTIAPKAWLTCRRIEKTLFTGYPTYIDYDCVIYIHDNEGHGILERMCLKLGRKYGSITPPPPDYKYVKGQPIVAAYSEKEVRKLYRCIVEGLPNDDSNEWTVRYIDYGNVETVGAHSMRPYAPYPNLKAIANKFRIKGIKPKFGAEKFSTIALDFIHLNTVARWVTVRISESELHKSIRFCKINHGAIDIAHYTIEEGYADHYNYNSWIESNLIGSNKPRNPILFRENSNNPFKPASKMDIQMANRYDNDTDDNDGDTEDEYEGLDELIEHLDNKRKPTFDQSSAMIQSQVIDQHDSSLVTHQLPKRRMFEDKEYTEMLNEMKVFESETEFVNDAFCKGVDERNQTDLKNGVHGDNDLDVIILEQGFENDYCYWNCPKDENLCEEEKEEMENDEQSSFSHVERDLESEFEQFNPNATSTAASHFSGIEFFKQPQLPMSMNDFFCSVASILKPTLLQVFPHHLEYEYNEMDMQRTIKRMVKMSPPLMKFEPRTVCLARYTKDKRWYRAVICKYSPDSKMVEVLYVDYLNSEALPVKDVRQCPKELLFLPLRTFRVRLYDVKPNPEKSESEIRSALHNLLSRRKLYAVIKKRSIIPQTNDDIAFDTTEDFHAIDTLLPPQNKLMNVVLYASPKFAEKGITVYESLIQSEMFIRI